MLLIVLLQVSCNRHPDVPSSAVVSGNLPGLYPDYTDVTLPVNLAAPSFMVTDASVSDVVARFSYPGGTLTFGSGRKVIIPPADWRVISESSVDSIFTVTLFTQRDGQWLQHPDFSIRVVSDTIDPWISYRLIEPSYVAYEKIDIMQRCLSDFTELTIASNHDERMQGEGHCLNCHSYQNGRTERMLFHVRGAGGGTMLVTDGKARLMPKMRQGSMISNPVYPSWHPHLPLVAFSTNHTGQLFHTQSAAKIEVQDTESELVLYDVDADSMTVIPSDITDLENFPTWSPDGRHLYYTSAHFECHDSASFTDQGHKEREFANRYTEVQYDIYVRDFDPSARTFSPRRLVLPMATHGYSASLPRVSPDGRFLLFARGQFGCFHIWHSDADICMLPLTESEEGTSSEVPVSVVDSLPLLNSSRADSYPAWSSNGRWISFASRRTDGNYSRICFAYFDRDAHVHKAFILPQADPEYDLQLLRSYNRPEPMVMQAPCNIIR